MDKLPRRQGLSENEWAEAQAQQQRAAGRPICSMCKDPIDGVWAVTWGTGHLICGKAACQDAVHRMGLTIATVGSGLSEEHAAVTTPKVRREGRQPRVCATCKGQLPRLRKDRFRDGQKQYCSLTCLQRKP